MAMTGRARRDESAQLMALVVNLIAVTQAVAQLREAQDRAAQATAARTAAEHLRTATTHRAVAARVARSAGVHATTRPHREPPRL
jgi:hypothetical protein